MEMLSLDEEEMFEKIREEAQPTQDMVIDLTYKVLQPRLEYIRMEQEELKEDKTELQDQNNDLKAKIRENLEKY